VDVGKLGGRKIPSSRHQGKMPKMIVLGEVVRFQRSVVSEMQAGEKFHVPRTKEKIKTIGFR
jgi:hypothetical protein